LALGIPVQSELLNKHYRGRFAPSPSGPLHAGSLVAALASYLDARAYGGTWLVRIENIDPPREVPKAADIILEQLATHGLEWDEPVYYQALSEPFFSRVLNLLIERGQAYYCNCTRKEIQARGGHYDGHCRNLKRSAKGASVRFKNDHASKFFQDGILGSIEVPEEFTQEDFVLKRRDSLWAYQLAVVLDDYRQGITHVVRGQDLLFPTVWQLALWHGLEHIIPLLNDFDIRSPPIYSHVKLQLDAQGRKLSKQNHAPALETEFANKNLCNALRGLEIKVPSELENASVREIIHYGIESWRHRKMFKST